MDEPITAVVEKLIKEHHPQDRLHVAGSPYVPLPDHVLAAVAAAASIHGYTPSLGEPALREAAAAEMSKFGAVVRDDEVLVTSGAMHALDLVFRTLLQTGDEVLMPGPGYFIGGLVRRAGANLIQFPSPISKGFRPDWSAAASYVTPQTKILYLNTPVNPTGYVFAEDDIDSAIGLARKSGLVIVSDESLSRFVYQGRQHRSPTAQAAAAGVLCVVVKSFSKDFAMPGIRVGYAVLPEHLFKLVAALLEWSVLCVSRPAQAAALAALTGPQDWVDAMVTRAEARGLETAASLNGIQGVECVAPQGGLNLFPKLEGDVASLAHKLAAQYGVPVCPGEAFGTAGHLRLQFGGVEEDVPRAVQFVRDVATQQGQLA